MLSRCAVRRLAVGKAPLSTHIKVDNPYTQHTIAEVPLASAEAAAATVHNSGAAQKSWAAVGLPGRIQLVEKYIDAVVKNKDSIALVSKI